ncbi:hypothetical protein GCM10017786_48990 [Amycolatopsis deserti]|uniref:DUF3558 domain-containing protein n=1 Tax=Amycolatopsis deserti TaxID=185696 RepID=A0ABQ3J845_9PSEU|nr:DUF3558 family protein [Amycolatopsis deserti]GHF09650.1 hypothetical protein GCM10017786_48990 [Amycolatopsis deserti]
MSSKNRTALVLAGVACAALTTAACTSTVSGTATPASSAPTTSSADVFAGLNACQVLDQLYAGQGFNPGENKTRRNECGILKPQFGSYGLALDPSQGLSEFAAANTEVQDISINGRNAMQANILGGGCAIAIEVTEHARAMVTVNMSNTTDDPKACPNARTLAEKVEPLLPKVQ